MSPHFINAVDTPPASSPQKLPNLECDDIFLDQLTLQLSVKNNAFRKGVLSPGATIVQREKDEEANLSLVDLCNTTQ